MISPEPAAVPELDSARPGAGDRAPRWVIESPGAVLAILALINFLNYVDRMVLPPLLPFLQRPVEEGGLALSSSQCGLLQSAFMIVHSLASIPLGIVADRFLRKRLIAIGVSVWSFATAAACLAQSFAGMFVARAAVGIGEAAYAPAASALISERFSPAARARALGIFQLGMVLGGAVGMVAGGMIGSRYGWRAAFLVVGLPGLLLTGLALAIHERVRAPSRAARPDDAPEPSLAIHLRSPGSLGALAWINLAGILITFFTGAIMTWAPKFILRAHYDGDPDVMKSVSGWFGAVAVVAGTLGTLAGSFVADRMESRHPGAGRLIAIAIGVFAGIPCAVIAFLTPSISVLYVLLGIGVFFNVWYVGPVLAALHDVVPPRLRSTATGAYLFLIHIFGDALSPPIVGFIDDRTGSLLPGLIVSVVVLGMGGVAALAAIPGSRRIADLKRSRAAP